MGASQSCPPPITCPVSPTYLGLNYTAVNKNTEANLEAVKNVISVVQQIGCQEIIPKLITKLQNEPKSTKKMGSAFIINMLTNDLGKMLKATEYDISKDSKKNLIKQINTLVTVIVTNASVDGMVSEDTAKQNMIDVYKSFCPSSMGAYVPPTPPNKSTFGSMETFGSCGSNIFIVILLIILAIVGFILYKNKDTIKIPTLSQRIANFGRQIKSIKRM
jgi:hypothetical protein